MEVTARLEPCPFNTDTNQRQIQIKHRFKLKLPKGRTDPFRVGSLPGRARAPELGKLSFAGLRPLDLEFVEQQCRTRDAEPDGFKTVPYGWRSSGGDKITAQRTDIEIVKHRAPNQLLAAIFGEFGLASMQLLFHGREKEIVGRG
jgi:hypothetical protein